jgi:Family of unknown function (DUF6804)
MVTKIMKWASVAMLFLAAFWRSSANFHLMLESVVCVAGVLVIAQAFRTGKYFWAAGFLAIAVLFNPVVPVGLPAHLLIWMDLACLAAFLGSLAAIRTNPVLSVLSITGRRSRIESL